jgi:outer membrane receptor protein involved in Fe transport
MHPWLMAAVFNAAVLMQSAAVVTGVVVDSSGAAVSEAAVRLEIAGRPNDQVRTASDGRFEFNVPAAAGTSRIVVTAPGFVEVTVEVGADPAGLRVVLQPAPFFEAVNVTSSRTDVPRVDPSVTMTVFSTSELLTSAALALDDALKAVPGFTLFRRTSSRVSNPTAQGVTLRGLGGTGASRSLVLADGVPLNDAFGGWVYWDKLPQVAIDRVEVLRGSGSDLYGADAVAGVVQILTWHPSRFAGRALVEGGNLATGRISMFGGDRRGGWIYNAGGEWFSIEGYIPVALEQDPGIAPRGPIDTKLGSTHRSGVASIERHGASGWRITTRGSVFTDNRKNGTPAVTNDTAARQATVEVTAGAGNGLLSARAFGATQGYDQTFSAVSANRTSEDLNRLQRVPTRAVGAAGTWRRSVGRHAVLVGVEGKFIKGETQETQLSLGRLVANTVAGGTQRVVSTFVQDTFLANDRLTLVIGAHGDRWHTESKNTDYRKTLGSFNPRASLAYRLAGAISLRGSLYRGFRPPTLNELYRGFRAGNTQTNPNEALAPERLTGVDAGLLVTRGRVSARVTAYWNVLDDVITNITLSSTPQLITKLRANADKMRTSGIEIEADVRLSQYWVAGFSSGIGDARFKGDTSLRDNRVPQVPVHNLALTTRYNRDAWTASAHLRVTGAQFEDDLNVFRLRPATVLDGFISRRVGRIASAFVALENVFDNEYDVGRTPILTTGMPRTARAGVNVVLP